MRAVILGTGAVGSRAARQLVSTEGLDRLTIVNDDVERAGALAEALASADRVAVAVSPRGTVPSGVLDEADVLLLATPYGHRALAEAALEHGVHVVSASDSVGDVQALLGLDAEARERALAVVVGASFSPGLTCVLARHGATAFDSVEELHVASLGTGGPACARSHHRALSGDSIDWYDGGWRRRAGGSGRELCWFPDPVGGADCYRASAPHALLLVPAFPGVRRVTVRIAASRRDRLTAWLPMLRPPHPEGVLGATRVEVRGRRGPARDTVVYGAIDRPALAAAAVAAVAAAWAADGRLARSGAAGLAELVDEPVPFLRELARRGIRAAVFEGAGISTLAETIAH
jgi:saccharopine dehydrogenase-like NADP-dependent oxidoreductase